jgi:SHS2 domain-containing protein
MEKFKFFSHTADAKFQAFGQTLEETFVHAAYAVASLMWDREKIEGSVAIPVEVEGKDLEQLLANFLEEMLYLLDTRNFLLSSIQRLSLEKKTEWWKIRAEFKGALNTEEDFEIFGDVKAITYNEMRVKRRAPYMVQVVVDI